MTKVDLIIPVYKAQDSLARALASIVSQTILDDINVVIYIDGEDDEYSEIIEPYGRLIPNLSIYHGQENVGPGLARQFCVNNTESEFIMFLDADDMLALPTTVSSLLRHAEEEPNCAVYSGQMTSMADTMVDFFGDEYYRDNMVWLFGKMYRRSFMEEHNISFIGANSYNNEDVFFNTSFLFENGNVLFTDEVLYLWLFTTNSMTRVNREKYIAESYISTTKNMIQCAIEHPHYSRHIYASLIRQLFFMCLGYTKLALIRDERPDDLYVEPEEIFHASAPMVRLYDQLTDKFGEMIDEEQLETILDREMMKQDLTPHERLNLKYNYKDFLNTCRDYDEYKDIEYDMDMFENRDSE